MYANVVYCFHVGGIIRNIDTDVHDVGCVLNHVEHEDGFCLLGHNVYVICVVVDGVENCAYVVDVVDVVVIIIFMLFDSGAVGVFMSVCPYILSLERGYWFGYVHCIRWYPG